MAEREVYSDEQELDQEEILAQAAIRKDLRTKANGLPFEIQVAVIKNV